MRCELCHTDNARHDGRCGPGCPRHASPLLDEADIANIKALETALRRAGDPEERHRQRRAGGRKRHA